MAKRIRRFSGIGASLDDIITEDVLYGISNDAYNYNIFAKNSDIDTDIEEDIWAQGGVRALPDGVAETMSVVSTSTADDVAGTGAQLCQLEGLDENYDLTFEIITMDGTTPVVSTTSFQHVHRITAFQVGSGTVNAGEITVTGSTSSNVWLNITAGESISHASHFMIPRFYKGFLMDETFSVYRSSGTGTRNGEITSRFRAAGTSSGVLKWATYGLSSSTADVGRKVPPTFPEKSLIWYSGLAPANNTAFSVTYDLLLIHIDRLKGTDLQV